MDYHEGSCGREWLYRGSRENSGDGDDQSPVERAVSSWEEARRRSGRRGSVAQSREGGATEGPFAGDELSVVHSVADASEWSI